MDVVGGLDGHVLDLAGFRHVELQDGDDRDLVAVLGLVSWSLLRDLDQRELRVRLLRARG